MVDLTLNNIPLEWVRAFEAAGRAGSFTAAASDLNVTQAAISQRIANLEGRIGSPLFIRGARVITLTVDGETWLPYVSAALRDLSESYEGIFGTQREKLTISASASIIELWLVPKLQSWQPGNQLQIVFSTQVLASAAQHRGATIRVEYGVGDWPAQHKCKLFNEVLCPVASPDLLSGGRDWRTLPRIALSGPRAGWQDWARHSGDPATPVPKLRFDSFAAALKAAALGQGVLLASLPLCRRFLGEKDLVCLSKDQLETSETYWILAHKDEVTKSYWDRICAHFL
ncbi:MAG: LysR family transcriptional regulator [Paracoccaceae bacterium]